MIHLPSPELREDVHDVLDEIWLNAVEAGVYDAKRTRVLSGAAGRGARKVARERTYAWLAEQMWLTEEACHVSRFTFDQCMEAICLLHGTTSVEIRAWAKQREADRTWAEHVERRRAA